MNRHLTGEERERWADGEAGPESAEAEQHLRQCARCASEALRIVQMKRAIHDAMSEETGPLALRERVRRQMRGGRRRLPVWSLAAAAAVALVLISVWFPTRSRSALPELADMHVTLLASANPVDVISTDRHTVKPWFEGRLPFTVPIPDLSSTAFRLMGGRVVYWNANPAAYLLIGKGAHRISVFVFRDELAPRNLRESPATMSTDVWRSGGLTFVAVGQVPREDLEALRATWEGR